MKLREQEEKIQQQLTAFEDPQAKLTALELEKKSAEEVTEVQSTKLTKVKTNKINGGMQTTGSKMNGASLGMKDESGEEFNNTYLKDL